MAAIVGIWARPAAVVPQLVRAGVARQTEPLSLQVRVVRMPIVPPSWRSSDTPPEHGIRVGLAQAEGDAFGVRALRLVGAVRGLRPSTQPSPPALRESVPALCEGRSQIGTTIRTSFMLNELHPDQDHPEGFRRRFFSFFVGFPRSLMEPNEFQ